MKKRWSLVDLVVIVLLTAVALPAFAQETKYAAGSTSAAVTFGPGYLGKTVVKSLCATTDKAGGAVKFYARGGADKVLPSATPTNGAVVIDLVNTGHVFTNGDIVVYAHASGVCDQTTIASATETNVTLTAGITEAGASGDALYEVTQQGQMLVGMLGTGVGTNDVLNISGDALFVTSGNSPLYVVLDGTAACVLQVIAGK
jgi:hypothetical protein